MADINEILKNIVSENKNGESASQGYTVTLTPEDAQILLDQHEKIRGFEENQKLNDIRERVYQETGVPSALLNGADLETCMAQATAIKEYINTIPRYPVIKDNGETFISTN